MPDEQPTSEHAEVRAQLFDMLVGFMRTQALSVIAKLGVADVLTSTPMDVSEIARRVSAHEPSLYRLLRFLATEGVFAEVEPRRFTETALSNGLRTDAPVTARWLAIMLGSEQYRSWGDALHSFMTGEPAFDQVYGSGFFDYLAEHPDASGTFDRAMAAGSQGRVADLLSYDWTGIERVADIGGGNGAALGVVLASNPHLRGVLFDLPTVVVAADEVLRDAGVLDRCDIVGGDFFTDSLPPADVYVLSQILHDWNDERASAILRNCRRTLADDGRLLLVEGIVPDGPEPDFGKLFDLHMLVLVGGKERTESEWRALLAQERFEFRQVTPDGLIEARPV
ncbi:MAG: methyltransferase [Actinobacteria bacterium]|nr:methyltransferase [Actinomycetota bacterium]MDQ3425113.1 acetylserotonin O-methyltransferase [Actinomycetota bacterium]